MPNIIIVTRGIADLQSFITFLESSRYSCLFNTISYVATHTEAVKSISSITYESLFVEDDRVSFYYLFAPLKKKYLCVFEEGVGTYCSDYNVLLKGIRRIKWQLLSKFSGCGMHFGGGRKTDHIFVTDLRVYNKLVPKTAHKAIEFPGIVDTIRHDSEYWRYHPEICNVINSAMGCRVSFIIGDWGGVNASLFEKAKEISNIIFYKPHPHDAVQITSDKVITIASSWIPAEIYLTFLAPPLTQKLTVFHHGSSAFFYSRQLLAKVQFIDVLNDAKIRKVYDA